MHAELSQRKIKAALKAVMQKRQNTYADLAKVWDCSLPTVKRQLGPEEMPLSRLLTALEWLDLKLSDLQKLAESESLERPKYTARQNEFLAKNIREFAFLMKLYENQTPTQIARHYGLSAAELEKILIRLEKHDLVKVGAGGRVRPFHSPEPFLNGPLALLHMNTFIDRAALFQKRKVTERIHLAAQGEKNPDGQVSLFSRQISERAYLDFLGKLRKLVDDFEETARLEENSLKSSQLKTAVLSLGVLLCESNDRDLPLVNDLLDSAMK